MPEPRLPAMPLACGRPQPPERVSEPQTVFPLLLALLAGLIHRFGKLRAFDAPLEQAAP